MNDTERNRLIEAYKRWVADLGYHKSWAEDKYAELAVDFHLAELKKSRAA